MPRRRDGALPKSAWGPGPWQHEPDQLRWTHDGLECYVYRHSAVTGSLNGYVAVPPEHPWWGKTYNECVATPQCEPEAPTDWDELEKSGFPAPRAGSLLRARMSEPHWSCSHRIESLLEVHGGVTYSGPMSALDPDDQTRELFAWGFGFDTGHAGDVTPAIDATLRMIYLAQPGGEREWAEHQRIMKDGLLGSTYKTLTYVTVETNQLAVQLALARNAGWQFLHLDRSDETPPDNPQNSRRETGSLI